MPQTPIQTPPQTTKLRLKTGHIAGLISAVLIAIAAFAASYAYMDHAAAMQSQAAAAAAAAAAEAIQHTFDSVNLEAKSAIVVDLTDGHILYQKNANAQLPLASITKVAMALAVSEVLDPNSTITIPYDTAYAGTPPTRLLKGETWTIRNVMNFTLVASSNEGADILATEANDALHAKYPQSPDSAPYGATVWRMNDIAHSLGMTQTYFLNTNGLDLSTTQSGAYSSARDIAKLMAYAASTSPETFVATTKDSLHLVDEDGDQAAAHNTNEALGDIPGLIMGKTGFTDLAGGNLAVVFDVGLAHPVVAVVLGSSYEGRFTDMRTLVNATRDALAQ